VICQGCGATLEAGARFCPACGTPSAQACASCGLPLPVDARFCPACGAPSSVAGAAPQAAAARERKVATILFADIVGYTSLTEDNDPELVQSVVGSAFERLSQEVSRYEGVVEKFAGDAMLALFGVPQAHEDDPERGVRAALEMQAAMSERAADLRAAGRPELQLRIGLETGDVLVDMGRVAGERDRMVTGDPVNTAARLQSVAAPGAIVVGPGTYAATRELVEYEELESFELKGKALPVPGWRAVRVKARRGGLRAPLGLEAPLIGRDEELGLLKETVRRFTAEDRPQMITVIGAAGVGKSRLAWELEKYIDGLPQTYHWRKGRYLSYGQPSYGGLIETIRADAGARDDDSDEVARQRLDERLGELGLAGDPAVEQALATLLGWATDTVANRDDLFEAWRRYLEAIARLAPLVLVLEDVHWADEGSLDFIDFLARWAEAPILLVCLARHELMERRTSWGGGIANSTTIMLEPLDAAENEALLDALLPGSLPASFRERIAAVAEGNPLFSEELVRMLIDRGIARVVDGSWELVAPVEELDVPRSIHALLAARLDSLPASEKRVTQAAAVVGRIFWDAVVAHVVAGALPELDLLLRGLRVKELVVLREPSSLAGSREFGFRHVLIRDVAYESVPKAERAEKHLQVARWAEERLAAREEELVELLASHYHRALTYRQEVPSADGAELANLRERVLEYGRRAGRRAADLWESRAAAAWFRIALEQAERLDLARLERARIALEYLDAAILGEPVEQTLPVGLEAVALIEGLAEADSEALSLLARLQAHVAFLTYGTGRADEARAVLEGALARVEGGPPTQARALLLWRLGWLTWRAFSPGQAVAVLQRAVAEAREVGDAGTERLALHDLGIAFEYSGSAGDGLRLLEQSLELAREAGDQQLMLRSYINLPALMTTVSWEVERAEAIAREGLERARRGGQRFFVCFLACNIGQSAAERGNADEGLRLLEEAHRLATELGDENLLSLACGFRALLYLRYGRLDEAVPWWAEAQRHGTDEPQASGTGALARAHLRWPEDDSAAVSGLIAALPTAGQTDFEVARHLARMAARTGQLAEARAAIRRVNPTADTARKQAEAAWRDALLDEPSAEGVERIREVGEQYEVNGYVLIAADAFSDASLVALRAGLAEAVTLARRSRELYERHGAIPVLDGTLEAIGSPARQPAEAS
jgi:class 3 adenylate cyclase/tetratricopeptide (TPR) repeat protein